MIIEMKNMEIEGKDKDKGARTKKDDCKTNK